MQNSQVTFFNELGLYVWLAFWTMILKSPVGLSILYYQKYGAQYRSFCISDQSFDVFLQKCSKILIKHMACINVQVS